VGRTIQKKISPTKQTSNSTSVSLLNFARLFHQKQIILKWIFYLVSLDKNTFPSKGCNCNVHCKTSYDKSFTKDTFLIHPTIIPFLTAMKVNDTRSKKTNMDKDIVENLPRKTAEPFPLDCGEWQGNNNMGNNVTPRNPHSIIMEGGKEYIKLQPFTTPINHNTLISEKAIQIVHPLMGNFCHRDKEKISQMEDMGNNACLLMGYHNNIRSPRLCQIILVMNNLFHHLTQVSIFRESLPITINQLT
jgi:hypothetical protein